MLMTMSTRNRDIVDKIRGALLDDFIITEFKEKGIKVFGELDGESGRVLTYSTTRKMLVLLDGQEVIRHNNHTHTHTLTHIHTHTHTYKHIHTHTHIHKHL